MNYVHKYCAIRVYSVFVMFRDSWIFGKVWISEKNVFNKSYRVSREPHNYNIDLLADHVTVDIFL